MSNQSISINVHSGTTSVFSRTFPSVDTSKNNNTAALVSSLREAQVAVNQFLTELVVKSGSQGGSLDQDEEVSDGDKDEEDASEAEDQGSGVGGKRKCDKISSSPATSDKRAKT